MRSYLCDGGVLFRGEYGGGDGGGARNRDDRGGVRSRGDDANRGRDGGVNRGDGSDDGARDVSNGSGDDGGARDVSGDDGGVHESGDYGDGGIFPTFSSHSGSQWFLL